MNNFIKRILALSITAFAAISLSISALADNSSTASVQLESGNSYAANSSDSSISSADIQTSSEVSNSKADTDNILSGNADLIKEQKIIHDSSEMQFIAVTTKAGNVFYILIDYTATQDNKSGEGAVYFLNKVDEQDLYALINNPNTSNDNENATEGIFVDKSSQTVSPESVANEVIESSELDSQAAETAASNSGSGSLKLLIFVVIIVGGVGVGYYFIKIRPKKNEVANDDDDFEFEEREVNEDEEKAENNEK